MKRNLARQHSRHRDRTPSVICLPPPKPPVVEKKSMALADPASAERIETRSPHTPRLSRQARRKALRDEAKAELRQQRQTPGAVAPKTAEPKAETPVTPPPAEAPLPRAQSLTVAKPRGLALFTYRLRAIFGLRPPKAAAAQDGAMASQLRALRDDLAALQRSLDRLIDGVAA